MHISTAAIWLMQLLLGLLPLLLLLLLLLQVLLRWNARATVFSTRLLRLY